ncbi:hypothetical protein LSH36_908g01069 [Paralvinella palmiformis]|uniref:Uncharacterized protein n=1 Tax=Paralvinella palmiformis TaxID=53620 RepID=A0AAD9MRJ2_9ANNE|nr:hypothetical protein LSH36_908g01069 [Paralvinella palmiformis]
MEFNNYIDFGKTLTSLTFMLDTGHGFVLVMAPEKTQEQRKRIRATGLLCLLGIGLGLGSVLLYKLCTHIISPAVSSVRRKKRRTSSENGKVPPTQQTTLSPETPDSGISTGTTLTHPVSSNAVTPDATATDDKAYSLRYRTHEPRPSYNSDAMIQYSGYRNSEHLNQIDQSGDLLHPHNKLHSGAFASSAVSDQGFVSGHYQSHDRMSQYCSDHESVGCHSMPAYSAAGHMNRPTDLSYSADGLRVASGYPDRVFSPIHHADSKPSLHEHHNGNYAKFHGAFRSTSTPQPEMGITFSGEKPFLRRNMYSRGSNLSTSTDYSAQDSMYSADNTDGLSFLNTSASDIFERESVGTNSNVNIEQIHQEIRMIREEISEMNDRVQVLSSRENLEQILMLTPNPLKEEDFEPPLEVKRRKHVRTRERNNSGSRSCDTSIDGDEKGHLPWRRSFHHVGEYIWDYQSDLAAEESLNFIAQRPLIQDSAGDRGDRIDYDSPTFDHVRKYIESCCNANITPKDIDTKMYRQQVQKSQTFNSTGDMYIDDSLSEFGDYTLGGSFEKRNVPDGCYSNANTTMTSGEFLDQRNAKKPFTLTHCDTNGNRADLTGHGDSVNGNYGITETEQLHGSDHSICLECGSPSHRRHCRGVTSATSSRNSLNSGGSSGSEGFRNDDGLRTSCPRCGHHILEDGDGNNTLQRNKRRRWQVMNIGSKINIFEYVEKNFKGEATSAQVMKKGYHQIPRLLGKTQIRLIRGDSYCVLRAVLYQICVNNYHMMQYIGSYADTIECLAVFDDPQYSFLKKWSFANRLPYDSDSVMDRIQDCLESFYTQMDQLSSISSSSAREIALVELLNFDPEVDLKLMEAVKVLMMLKAIKMYESYMGLVQSEVSKPPVFVWLMYSRQSSQTPEALFNNHINPLGDVSPAHQVELFLLGYTLGVKIEIVRPPRYGQDDFISHYPDDGADNFPTVSLVAEDDRHYHVITI